MLVDGVAFFLSIPTNTSGHIYLLLAQILDFPTTNTHVSSISAYVSNLILALTIALTIGNWCQ